MKLLKTIVAGVSALALFGCSPSIEAYKDVKPKFDIRTFFDGELEGFGMLQDRNGKVTRRFSFTMRGSFNKEDGTLKEAFIFDDGEKQTRTWSMSLQDDHTFTAVASDGVGTATGKQYGNAVNMQYVLKVATDGKTYDIDFDDWLYLQPNGEVLNQTTLKKFGITVGKLTITIRKKAGRAAR